LLPKMVPGIVPGQRMGGMASIIRFFAIAIAIGVGLASVSASVWFGLLWAEGTEGIVYASIFGGLDALKLLLPTLAAFAFTSGFMWRARAALVLYAALAAWGIASHVGLYSVTKDHTIGGAKEAQSKYEDVRARRLRLETELAELGKPRPVATIAADISTAERNPLFARSLKCVDDTVPASQEFCAKWRSVSAERANAERVVVLRAEIDQADRELRLAGTSAVFRRADPQAEQLSILTGLSPDQVRLSLAVLIAVLVELGSSLTLVIAEAPLQRSRRKQQDAELDQVANARETPGKPVAEPQTAPGDLDTVAAWVQDALTRRKSASLICQEARRLYEEAVQAAGGTPVSANAFGRAMSDLGYQRKKIGGKMHYAGAALRRARPTLVASA
jgi:hypothetical protein